jgi:hypothetical protein
MPDEIRIAVAAEEGIAYLESHPGTLSKMAEFVAQNYKQVALLGAAALGLAGCSKGKDKAAPVPHAAAKADTPVINSGDDLSSGAGPAPAAKAVARADGQGNLSVLNRLADKELPTSLVMQDLPAASETNRQFVSANVDHLILENNDALSTKQDYGWFGSRDLKPTSDVAPNSGSRAGTDYAVTLDKANRPVDVLAYQNPGTGNKYVEQYQFNYGQLTDGTNRSRVTVYDWKDSTQTNDVGPQQVIGNKLNTLEGVSQYYYDSTGKCVEAVYYNGWALKGPKSDWKPVVDMKFEAGQISISEQNPRSGQMTPFSTPSNSSDAALTVRYKAANLKFFDLLGPTQ